MVFPGKKLAGAVLFLGILAGLLAGGFYGLVYDLPEINQLKRYRPSAVSTIYSADNQVISRFYVEKRFPVSLETMPRFLVQALIVTEDRHFFSHSGLNVKAVARAIFQDIRTGRLVQGGSTLTQQLAKTLFLSSEKSMVRKIREALLAVQIERRYTKNEILELYLNQIYLGSGAFGVEAAAQTYFDTTVSGVTLGQAALIAGLPKAPSVYSPLISPERAAKRRAVVLKLMLDQGLISREAQELANAEPVTQGTRKTEKDPAPDYTAFLENELAAIPDLGTKSGLTIKSTLDLRLHQIAITAVAGHLDRLQARMERQGIVPASPQAALVALDVHTGALRTMIGGRSPVPGQFNRSVQALRQPGSSFKPFLFAAALEKGWEQNQTLLDAPLSYPLPNGTSWEVSNFSRDFRGEMTLRKALALSKNTPAVRLAEKLGPVAIVDLARRAGITAPLPPYLSLALGTAEVNLLELSSAYSAFPAHGTRALPYTIEEIVDANGLVRFSHTVRKQTVTDRVTAALTCDLLKSVMTEGTAITSGTAQRELAGKTGTTDRYKDALFIGFSPDLACGVWVGNDDATTLGPGETGARAALPIWTDVMEQGMAGHPLQYFDIPDGTKMIYILPDTGQVVPEETPGAVKALVRAK